jgi:hypothetical protein
MSLRKSPELTPELLAAARQNGQRSAGPSSDAGKQNSKLNALKHGQRASPENHRLVMLALGEDPQEFDDLKQDLMLTYGPGDPLWEKQIDDLARLYWRRQRLERAQEGMMRRALLAVEEGQHRHRQEIAGATFGPAQPHMLDVSMPESADPGVRLRRLLSCLEVVREQAKQRTFSPRQHAVLETLYQGMPAWRPARICRLLRLFGDSTERSGGRIRSDANVCAPGNGCADMPKSGASAPPAGLSERKDLENKEHCKLAATGGAIEEAGEAEYEELLRLLEEEIAYMREEFVYAEKLNEEKAAIERDAALAPVGEAWSTLVRQQAALDRSIDRKVRILLALRKELTGLRLAARPSPTRYEGEMERIDKLLGTKAPSWSALDEGAGVRTKSERASRECP